MPNGMQDLTLGQINNNIKQFGQNKILDPTMQFLGQPIGPTQIMAGALPATSAALTTIPNYNEAIIEGENPIGTLPWGTIGGAGSGALLAALFAKLAGTKINPATVLNGGLMGMGIGGTIDSIRNSW